MKGWLETRVGVISEREMEGMEVMEKVVGYLDKRVDEFLETEECEDIREVVMMVEDEEPELGGGSDYRELLIAAVVRRMARMARLGNQKAEMMMVEAEIGLAELERAMEVFDLERVWQQLDVVSDEKRLVMEETVQCFVMRLIPSEA